MDTIYIVTSGSYSDYGIRAVFDSKELAQKFIDKSSFDEYDPWGIEEYEINPNKDKIMNEYFYYFVRMEKNGNCKEVYKSRYFDGKIGVVHGFDVHTAMCCNMYAKNDEHAIKIANEKRMEVLALNKWGKNSKSNG